MAKAPSKSTRRKSSPRRNSGPTKAALREMVRPIVRELVAEELEPLEDRLDYLESESSLRDGKPVPAGKVWKELGL